MEFAATVAQGRPAWQSGVLQRINRRAMADCLSLSYVPDPDTIYENAHKLAPGSALLATASGFRVWRYWQLGDICVTAPNRRPAAITKIVAQIEYAHSGEVKDDSAEESKADYSSRGYQG